MPTAINDSLPPPDSGTAWRDAACVLAATALVGWLSVHFEFNERLALWTNAREVYQLDELPGILLCFALGMLWFAHRRHREARHAQQALARSLRENRRLAQQTLTAQETERKHLARELHDELGQYLNAIKIDAVAVQRQAFSSQLPALAAILRNTDHVYWVINQLIRKLRPAGLDDLGLAAALESCVDDWRSRLPSITFSLQVESTPAQLDALDEPHQLTLYRIVQEGLTNAIRHGEPGQVTVTIRHAGDAIEATVQDDGRRSDDRSATSAGSGLGLIGMRERVQALDGALTAERLADAGFRLAARLPLHPAGAEAA